jgi:hypothetical protein
LSAIVSNNNNDDTNNEGEEETVIGPRDFPATPLETSFNLDGPSLEGAVPAPVIIKDEEDR